MKLSKFNTAIIGHGIFGCSVYSNVFGRGTVQWETIGKEEVVWSERNTSDSSWSDASQSDTQWSDRPYIQLPITG